MTISSPIPVTAFTGFLGAGKTTTILNLLEQLPKDHKVVLVKNEYGDVEVDSLLAQQSNITGVSEILNGCLCCTMVGLVENALIEIRDTYHPDRIIIESSGSAFPATLALQIRELEPQGFKLDGVVTVIDCVNFRGYEDNSPTAKLSAQYTDLLLLSKHELCTERELDILMDHIGELNDSTPSVKVGPKNPLSPDLVFGLDSKLFLKGSEEAASWAALGVEGAHTDEVETKSVWRGGAKPGSGKKQAHAHPNSDSCTDCNGTVHEVVTDVTPIPRADLEAALAKLAASREVYRAKGIVRFPSESVAGYDTYVLNWAFGRFTLTHIASLDAAPDLEGVSIRLTVMGERWEVRRHAKKFGEALGAQVA